MAERAIDQSDRARLGDEDAVVGEAEAVDGQSRNMTESVAAAAITMAAWPAAACCTPALPAPSLALLALRAKAAGAARRTAASAKAVRAAIRRVWIMWLSLLQADRCVLIRPRRFPVADIWRAPPLLFLASPEPLIPARAGTWPD